MVLMERDNKKEFVPDIFTDSYLKKGYEFVNKCNEIVIPPIKEKPEQEETKEESDDGSPASFVCSVCGKEYKTENAFVKHMQSHTNEEN